MRRRSLRGVLAGLLMVMLAQPAFAQGDFYKGKTITIVLGARLTGSLSIAAQMVSRHLGRHIPGNPTVILRQMPGAAHLNATNHVRRGPASSLCLKHFGVLDFARIGVGRDRDYAIGPAQALWRLRV